MKDVPWSVAQALERLRLPRGQVWREGTLRQVTVHQFYGDVWKVLQEATNFSFSMVRRTTIPDPQPGCPQVGSVDYNWGSKLENGSWNGMVGMILRDQADIAVSSFFATKVSFFFCKL